MRVILLDVADARPAFYLKRNESVPHAVLRALQEQLVRAACVLRSRPSANSIHDARKCLKRARSLSRLVRSGLGSTYGEINGRLAEFGRCLSRVRDAAALIESAERLAGKADSRKKALALQVANALLSQEQAITRDFLKSGDSTEIVDGLQALAKSSNAWHLEHVSFDTVLEGFDEALTRGRKAIKIARRDPKPENLHEFRKRAKDFRYFLNFLYTLSPDVLNGYGESANDVEQKLGEDHNLTLLCEKLKDLQLTGRDLKVLIAAIEKRQTKLRKWALQAGAILYSGSSKYWQHFLKGLWRGRK